MKKVLLILAALVVLGGGAMYFLAPAEEQTSIDQLSPEKRAELYGEAKKELTAVVTALTATVNEDETKKTVGELNAGIADLDKTLTEYIEKKNGGAADDVLQPLVKHYAEVAQTTVKTAEAYYLKIAEPNAVIFQLSQLMIALDPKAVQRDNEELAKLLDPVSGVMEPVAKAQAFVAPIVGAVEAKFDTARKAGVEVSDAEVAAEYVTASGNAMATTAKEIAKRKGGQQ